MTELVNNENLNLNLEEPSQYRLNVKGDVKLEGKFNSVLEKEETTVEIVISMKIMKVSC